MSLITRSAKTLGALAAVGAVAFSGSAAHAAEAKAAPKAPWMKVSLSPTVKGDTVTYRYSESGVQHLVTDSTTRKPYNNGESAGYIITADGKTVDGGEMGDPTCTNTGLGSFKNTGSKTTLKFAKAGRHTLRVTGYYCGNGGVKKVSRSYTVVTTAAKPAPKPAPKTTATLKAAGAYTVGKPLALTGTCASGKTATATVIGPRTIKGTLKKAGKGPQLTGTVTVPKELKGSWVRLRMTCADGSQATTIAKKVGAKGSVPTA